MEEEIIGGYRPGIPADCPPLYQTLMTHCWHAIPSNRPRFEDIVSHLKEIASILTPEYVVSIMYSYS